MRTVQTVSLFAATITTGLMAGLFTAFAYAIMPALKQASDRTFVETMQRINVAILNGWFMTCFLGAVVAAAAAVAVHLSSDRRLLPWIIAGLVLYIAVLVVTGGVNVPLNNELEQAGNPDRIADLAAVRQHFEDRWVAWNVVRAVANTAAFALLTWTLVLHGRTEPADQAAPAPAPVVQYAQR